MRRPFGLVALLLACTDPTPQPEAPDAGSAFDVVRTDALRFLEEERNRLHLPGVAVAVVRAGAVAWVGAAGKANLESGLPATGDTPFLIASVSKSFIAVAVMQAFERGLVRLDDDVRPLLPLTLRHPRARDTAITWRMLLTHTSGIRDSDVIDELVAPGDPTMSLAEFLREYLDPQGRYYDADDNFTARPGTTYEYTDVGSSLAAYLVERVSEVPFDRWCDAEIFQPLELAHTSWRLASFDPDEVAMPYAWSEARGFEAYGHYGFPDYPDGGLRASVRDLATYLAAISRGGAPLLKASSTAELLREQGDDEAHEDQALIWYFKDQAGRRLVGHQGHYDGARAELFFDPADGVGVVVVTNGEPGEAELEPIENELYRIAKRL